MDSFSLAQLRWIDLGILAAVFLFVAVTGRWLIRLVVDRGVRRLTGRTETILDDALVDALGPPLYWLLLLVTLDLAFARLEVLREAWKAAAESFFFVSYSILAFVLLWRVLGALFTWYGAELAQKTDTSVDDQLVPVVRRVTLFALAVITLVMLLSHFGVEVSGLVATLGIGSLAIALAAQASLSDIFSGFVIMVDRPYGVADRIEILDLNTWGDVVGVGLRSTRIRTRDNRMVIVPNSVIGKSLIVNHSYPDSHYRIETEVGVAYGSDVEAARSTMVEAAQGVEGVWGGLPVEALFLQMGDSALVFRVRVWIESFADARRVTDRVNTAIYNALNEAGIVIPFPQREVHHHLGSVDSAELGRLASGLG